MLSSSLRPLVALLMVCLALCLGVSSASAQGTQLDWQRGLLIARAAAPGDLRSPNRQLARVKAERVARRRCVAKLRAAAVEVPRAPGAGAAPAAAVEDEAKEGEAAKGDGLEFLTLATDRGSDGSVVVTMALPLDSLRSPGDELVPENAGGPELLLVDARATGLKPALGFRLSDGAAEYQGPTLFFLDEKQARADARVGKDARLIPVKRLEAGVLHIEEGALGADLSQKPLVLILYKARK